LLVEVAHGGLGLGEDQDFTLFDVGLLQEQAQAAQLVVVAGRDARDRLL